MSNYRHETELEGGSDRRQSASEAPVQGDLAQVQRYPELVAVVTQAVDEVLTTSSVDCNHAADLVEDAERAATATALTTYQRMAVAANEARDAADHARRRQANAAAAAAEVVAERVTETAAALHHVEEASAAQVALVAAHAAAELAASVGPDDEMVASAAAALVVEAVGEAAAVKATARAEAASLVARAAADAAAEVADEATSTASAAEQESLTDASVRQQDALETCYQVAVTTAQAMLTHHSGTSLIQPPHPPIQHA